MDYLSGIAHGVGLSLIVAAVSTLYRQKRYHYYVSFYIIASDNSTGFGSMNIIRTIPVDSLAEVQALGETIRREQNAKGVTILNIQKLRS